MAVTWQEWGSLHFFPNSINPYFCQGLAPSVILPLSWLLLLSAQTCSESFLRQKQQKQKHKTLSENVVCFLFREEEKNKWGKNLKR